MKIINWGIIGLGNIANKFASDINQLDNCKLYGAASRSQDKADEFKNKYDAEVAYNSYEALAEDPNIDAVYIATPHSYHKEHSILCLNNKKAVLCEKPFAMNKGEVEEMIACAEKNETLLMEALWTFFLPHYQYVIDKISSNEFGKLLKLEADFGFKADLDPDSRLYKKSLGGGSLLDIGIYPIFAALSSLGYPLTIESKATFFDNGVDSSCLVLFSYPDGVKAELKSTIIQDTPTTAFLKFEKGTILINTKFHMPSSVTISVDYEETHKTFDYNTHGYSYEIEHFNHLLRNGLRESPIMTFEFSRQLISLLDTVRNQIGLSYK